jgi:hypothetical protein
MIAFQMFAQYRSHGTQYVPAGTIMAVDLDSAIEQAPQRLATLGSGDKTPGRIGWGDAIYVLCVGKPTCGPDGYMHHPLDRAVYNSYTREKKPYAHLL